jgi:hypothetical protein
MIRKRLTYILLEKMIVSVKNETMTDVRRSDVKARKPHNSKTYTLRMRGKNRREDELVLRVRPEKSTMVSLSRNNPTILVIYWLFLFVSILSHPVQETPRIKVLNGTGLRILGLS